MSGGHGVVAGHGGSIVATDGAVAMPDVAMTIARLASGSSTYRIVFYFLRFFFDSPTPLRFCDPKSLPKSPKNI